MFKNFSPMRLIHNRGIVKYVLALVGIIIALYFAWMFYPFGEWSGKQFLADVPAGPQILGLICACIMGGLVLLLLFHKEYMREDTKAYSAITRDSSFNNALNMFVWFVMGLELFSILFRITVLGTSKYNAVLFGVGIVAMGLTYVIGKVLHAQVNRPASVEAGRIINDAGNEVLGRARNDMGKLTSDDLRQVHSGNFNPFNKIIDARNNRQLRKQQEEDEKQSALTAQQHQGKQAASTFLQPRNDDPTPIMTPGNNGSRPFE